MCSMCLYVKRKCLNLEFNMMYAIITFFLLIFQVAEAQIPRDTSYTIYSNHVKLQKKYPFVTPIAPALPANVEAEYDVVYKNLAGRSLHLDISYPKSNNKTKYPGVLMIHGGGWSSGSKAHQVPMAQQLAARGYVAVAVEYRLSPEAQYPAAVYDLKEAIRWMRAHADKYGLDVNKIAALGCSAGAQLASLLGTTNGVSKFEEKTAYPKHSSDVQAAVNVDGIVSFVHPEADAEGAAAAKWLGGTRAEAYENWREASPLEYVNAQTPPFIFINSSVPRFHAGRDDFIKVLNEYHIYSEVHTIADSPHSFWLVHPWFEPTLEYTYQFLDKIFTSNQPEFTIDTIAERMLAYQRACGGWPKSYFTKDRKEIRIDYNKPLTEDTYEDIRADSLQQDATYDNYATNKEINYLIQAYHKTKNPAYLKAVEKGIRYILDGQYQDSGGWPQFYPLRKGYYSHITYNDNAMVNNLNILYDVAYQLNGFEAVDLSLIKPSKKAVKKGIQCILNTQIKKDGKLMVWCAQYDRETLKPAKARAFELPSYSGQESVGIVRFLMRNKKPSIRIKNAITSAVEWFEGTKIEGYSYVFVDDPSYQPRGVDRVFVKKEGAVSWGRFYDLDTNEPFFCGRDGVKKKTVAEIEQERRVGYAWYGNWAEKLLEKEYPKWLKMNKINRN